MAIRVLTGSFDSFFDAGPGGINFGSVHDSSAALSSSPAVHPTSGEHLQGDKPALFGSVEAAKDSSSESKQKVVGFAGKESTPRPPMDFQKLFQGGGNKAGAPKQPAAAASASQEPAIPSGASPAPTGAPAEPAVEASPASRNLSAPAANSTATPSTRSPGIANATPTSQHAGARPFEPQQSPSPYNHQLRAPTSGGLPQFHPQQQQHGGPPQYQQQQHRSPHIGGYTPGMQQMMGAGQNQWQPQGQHQMYYPHMSAYGYHQQYNGAPGHHWNQQQQQPDMSPRVPASPMAPPPSSASLAPSTPANMSSPASSRAHAVPYSPSTMSSSVSSPQPHANHLGMGYPQGARAPPFVHNASGGYGNHAHAPSGSYGSGPGANPMMSPAARQFEPNKRASSAIRIVNPETKAAIDIKSPAPTAPKTNITPTATSTSSPALAPATPAAAPAPATPTNRPTLPVRSDSPAAQTKAPRTEAKNIETVEGFQARVRALADKNKQDRAAAAAAKEREAADEEAKKAAAVAEEERQKKVAADAEAAKKREEEETAARKAAEAEAASRKEAEEKERAAKEEAEKKEKEAREAAEAQEKAAREKAAAEAAAAEEQNAKEQASRKEAEAAADKTAEKEAAAAAPASASKDLVTEEAKLDAQEAAVTGEKSGEESAKDSVAALATARSVADIERMAREVSSVPSTPLEGSASRTSMFPPVPRTPGTPGFANLPAKPMASMSNAANNSGSIVLDSAQLEKRKRPQQLDTAAAQRSAEGPSSSEPPISAASATLGSARPIEDLSKVTYPGKVQSPRKELNEAAAPGKFRYDREFLLQFMNVWSEKPQDMPPLASIGMEQGQPGAGRASTSGRRASGMGSAAAGGGRGAAGLGLGLGAPGASAFGRPVAGGAMGTFSHPAKTSEERFAQSTSGLRGAPSSAFASSGPMGSFNAGSRTQPLSRGGSGSAGALPSREMMGTGAPAGSRTQSRRGRTREPGQSRGERVNPPERGGPTIPMDQVAPLANSESRWQAGTGSKLTTDSPELIQRKVKALLNKLTVEKFVSISDQVLDWANKSVEETDGRTLRQVIALIFEKATDEAAWSEMYAQLCRKLMEKLSPEVTDESLKGSDGKLVVGGALFRKYLLNRCQEDFERGWAHRDAMVDAAKSKEAEDKAKKDSNEKTEAEAKEAAERGEKTEEKEAELLSEEYYIAQKAKRRGLGLVRFIGELYKLQMLTEKIMHICIVKLLSNTADPEEEEIESLCKLLTTIGRQLDNEKARSHLNIYFQRMKDMTQSENVNSRMKFMLMDVIEMRANGWKGKQESAGPKSIAQIHEDAAKQKQQAELDMANRARGAGPPSRGGSRRGQQRGDMPGGAIGPDGWQTMGSAPPPRPARAGDLAAFGKIERGGSGRPLSLGPGPNSVFAKKQQKSSEDGSKPPSRTNSSANMFEMLNQAESSEQAATAGAAGAAAGGDEPQRPKLNLAPRTKPMPAEGGEDKEDGEAEEEQEEAADAAQMSDADAKRKIGEDVKEFLEIRNVDEGALAMESLPTSHRAAFVGKLVSTALDKKVDLVRVVGELLAKIRSSQLMDDAALEEGFTLAGIADLDDMSIDVPQVCNLMAILLVDSGLPEASLSKLAESIVGEGIKTPKDKMLEKVQAERESRSS